MPNLSSALSSICSAQLSSCQIFGPGTVTIFRTSTEYDLNSGESMVSITIEYCWQDPIPILRILATPPGLCPAWFSWTGVLCIGHRFIRVVNEWRPFLAADFSCSPFQKLIAWSNGGQFLR
ncbi:hypothetical protein ASPZODRAFT_128505 [Penicilliopsis zonata CBS 506.65]|uniref:Uncharacterized protein n=1 Tax=Penicilliopsis zonata CBS 506.65 TaxID=1073090 RepID=A0A1L9SRX5_9EURO|nr:hypothetical protein ASPZODRAFT_128505 [Penicilliopsis zonata CBS 506.65]OJJ49928.1 hypothetical protein ASPZODRAFT_128505 [Penicilliopsis zonata CBS 506.65]